MRRWKLFPICLFSFHHHHLAWGSIIIICLIDLQSDQKALYIFVLMWKFWFSMWYVCYWSCKIMWYIMWNNVLKYVCYICLIKKLFMRCWSCKIMLYIIWNLIWDPDTVRCLVSGIENGKKKPCSLQHKLLTPRDEGLVCK